MKKTLALKNSLRLIVAASLVVSCQKSGNTISAPKTVENSAPETAAVVPEKICSDKILKAQARLLESEDKSREAYAVLSKKNEDPKLKEALRYSTLQQVASCKSISALFLKEDSSACLKSETPKTIENTLFREVIENSCKAVLIWFARSKPTPAETALMPTEKKTTHYNFHFNESARELIQSKNADTFIYVTQGQIKKGKNQFQADLLAGNVACSFSSPSEAVTQELNFKMISEMPENSIDMDFPFSGKFFSLALEDSANSILSMTCLNTKIDLSPEKISALQNTFGKLILIETEDTKRLNTTAESFLNTSAEAVKEAVTSITTPTEVNKQEQLNNPSAEIIKTPALEKNNENKTAPQSKTDAAIDSAILKTKETISDVVKEAVGQVKAAADETRSTTIKEVTLATRELSKEFIAEAKTAAKEVVAESIQRAQTAVVNTSKAPFIYLNNKALEVKKEIKDSAVKAITFVKEKTVQLKDVVVATVTEQTAALKNKASAAKKAFMSSLKTPSQYWSDFLAENK